MTPSQPAGLHVVRPAPAVGPIGEPPPVTAADRFTAFVEQVEPRLRRALVALLGTDATHDAVADAFVYAWEHWDRVEHLANPAGYLYRVARSSARIRRPKRVRFLVPEQGRMPEVEPGLVGALAELTPPQRAAVWLIHACGWSYQETAEALDISASAVGTHLGRGMEKLRRTIGEAP